MTDIYDWESEGGFIAPTQEETFLGLMAEFGLSLDYRKNTDSHDWVIAKGGSMKQTGYRGFYCSWRFDEFGNFLSVGVWE